MSIEQFLQKIKPFYGFMLGALIAATFFCLGRLSVQNNQKTAINIDYSGYKNEALAFNSGSTTISSESPSTSTPDLSGEVIGSKSGKKYYFPWCGTVKRIKPENQVYFVSIEEARKAGFTPGGNCKGLQ